MLALFHSQLCYIRLFLRAFGTSVKDYLLTYLLCHHIATGRRQSSKTPQCKSGADSRDLTQCRVAWSSFLYISLCLGPVAMTMTNSPVSAKYHPVGLSVGIIEPTTHRPEPPPIHRASCSVLSIAIETAVREQIAVMAFRVLRGLAPPYLDQLVRVADLLGRRTRSLYVHQRHTSWTSLHTGWNPSAVGRRINSVEHCHLRFNRHLR